MSRIVFTLAALTVVALSGCKQIQIVDGKVPAGFETYAQAVTGAYSGHVEETSDITTNLRFMDVKIEIVDGRVVLTPSNDWIKEGCGSKVGNLLNVQASTKEIKMAAFAFDAGACKAPGVSDRLMVQISDSANGKPTLKAWVMKDASVMIGGTFKRPSDKTPNDSSNGTQDDSQFPN